MVRDEDVRTIPLKTFEARHFHFDPRRDKNQTRPGAGTPVRETAAALEEAGRDRQRAEHDGVQADSGDQIKDRSPPMERRKSHARAARRGRTLRSASTFQRLPPRVASADGLDARARLRLPMRLSPVRPAPQSPNR